MKFIAFRIYNLKSSFQTGVQVKSPNIFIKVDLLYQPFVVKVLIVKVINSARSRSRSKCIIES